ncbi:hypothetical protein IWX91DRAFT_154140 [Phyllosticta citricarpa]
MLPGRPLDTWPHASDLCVIVLCSCPVLSCPVLPYVPCRTIIHLTQSALPTLRSRTGSPCPPISLSSSFPVPGQPRSCLRHALLPQRKSPPSQPNNYLRSFVLPTNCHPRLWPETSTMVPKIAACRPPTSSLSTFCPKTRLTNLQINQLKSPIRSNPGPFPILIGDS